MFSLSHTHKRRLSALRRDFPCLLFGFWLALGEVLGFMLPNLLVITLACVFLLFFCFNRKLSLGIFALGLFLTFHGWNSDLPLNQEVIVEAEVNEVPRRPKPELMMLSLKLQKLRPANSKKSKEQKLDGEKIYCKAINLPWRNASKIEVWNLIRARIKLLPLKSKAAEYLKRHGFCGIFE